MPREHPLNILKYFSGFHPLCLKQNGKPSQSKGSATKETAADLKAVMGTGVPKLSYGQHSKKARSQGQKPGVKRGQEASLCNELAHRSGTETWKSS